MTKIKICGLKTIEDVEMVNRIQPEYVGFVFAPSKRRVSDAQAMCMKQRLSKAIQAVGVFVNDSIEHIVSLCKSGCIDLVQLHGDESEGYIKQVQQRTGKQVIKAVRLTSREAGEEALRSNAEYVLFDAFAGEKVYGGSGTRLETLLLPELSRPTFLAGGLSVHNVEEMVRRYKPFCVDVSSSVETDGKKEYEKMKQFVEVVRNIEGGRI